jgi:hypothetical protein
MREIYPILIRANSFRMLIVVGAGEVEGAKGEGKSLTFKLKRIEAILTY